MTGKWVEPDVRDNIVEFVTMITPKTSIPRKKILALIGINQNRYYSWIQREGKPNKHNGKIPGKHWCLDWEKEAIISYAKSHPGEGYRRLTYMMIDDNIVAVSPATTYRLLKAAGLLNRWNKVKRSNKGQGFDQPSAPHQHWHTDIKYGTIRYFNGSSWIRIGDFGSYIVDFYSVMPFKDEIFIGAYQLGVGYVVNGKVKK